MLNMAVRTIGETLGLALLLTMLAHQSSAVSFQYQGPVVGSTDTGLYGVKWYWATGCHYPSVENMATINLNNQANKDCGKECALRAVWYDGLGCRAYVRTSDGMCYLKSAQAISGIAAIDGDPNTYVCGFIAALPTSWGTTPPPPVAPPQPPPPPPGPKDCSGDSCFTPEMQACKKKNGAKRVDPYQGDPGWYWGCISVTECKFKVAAAHFLCTLVGGFVSIATVGTPFGIMAGAACAEIEETHGLSFSDCTGPQCGCMYNQRVKDTCHLVPRTLCN
ncbi:hypothetical protein M427DRAFT_155244 [Gonapodya prolifera JEL478]|uniref:Apple domain-containing protein n=1 Tax=Gonapodya prolifera (strain JEL478) TaxID=1344416 RepID=A0A139AFC2_GONPJ|nr:hypothetical protein M427DRAFT_155244 [Gonapodya prolifera JEL478]|eukprot:KXS15506.1 hypothetical protein M427DRAFT_155244 [Gonapodya prolifera JEL478]